MLTGKKILLGITGSIAAYKIPLLVRLLKKDGADVRVVMTPSAKDFVTPLTLSTLSGNPVLTYAKYAEKSVLEKQRERYELALEKYNTLMYMYPDSKYVADLEPVVEKIKTELTNIKTK